MTELLILSAWINPCYGINLITYLLLSTYLKLTNHIYTFSNKNIYSSTFVFLNRTSQVLQKVSPLNNIVNNKKYLYGCNIDHKFFCLRVYGLLYITISTYSYICLEYFNLQNNVRTYR